jgi:hypothetical protein
MLTTTFEGWKRVNLTECSGSRLNINYKVTMVGFGSGLPKIAKLNRNRLECHLTHIHLPCCSGLPKLGFETIDLANF